MFEAPSKNFQTPEKSLQNLILTLKISVSRIPWYQDSAVGPKDLVEGQIVAFLWSMEIVLAQ